MSAFRRLLHSDRQLVLALLALVLAMRVAVPAGWMPQVGADGQARLVLCSGFGAETPGKDKSAQHAEMPCVGAGVFTAIDTPPIALIATARPAFGPLPLPRLIVAVGQGLAAPPPPKTGPPATV